MYSTRIINVNTEVVGDMENIIEIPELILTNLTEKPLIVKDIWFGMGNYITSFTGRDNEIKSLHNELNTNKKIVVYGMPGVGKTELVRRYAWKYGSTQENTEQTKFYDNIIWITAETEEKVKDSLQLLTETINFRVGQEGIISEEETLNRSIRDEFYKTISCNKTLFIFDNVNETSFLKEYLPTEASDNLQIIITSQNDIWQFKNWSAMPIGGLRDTEAMELLNKILDTPEFNNADDDKMYLIRKLDGLPLALQIASAYIMNYNSGELTLSIREYMDLFEDDIELLLDYDKYCEYYNKTIYRTLSLTMKNITNELSKEILYISSYLSPDNIPKSMFISGTPKNSILMIRAVRDITKYSLMIETDKDNMKIHKLVQMYLRYVVERNSKTKEEIMLKVLEKIFIYYDPDNMDLKHIQTISNQLSVIFVKIQDEDILSKFYHTMVSGKKKDTMLVHICTSGNITAFHSLRDDRIFNEEALYVPILCDAAQKGRTELVDYFLENAKFIVNLEQDKYFKYESVINLDDLDGNPLNHAAAGGNIDILKKFILKGFPTNKKTKQGKTLLHFAVENNHIDVAQYILNKNLCEYDKDKQGYFPVHCAAEEGHLDMLKMLIKKGFSTDATTKQGHTLLHLAVQNNHASVVKFILDSNINTDSKNKGSWSSNHFAAAKGHLGMLKMLINRGFSTDATTDEGKTLLHLAVRNNHASIVEFLLDNNICTDSTDNEGWSSNHIAAAEGHLDMLKMLISRGFSRDTTTNEGKTLLHLAVISNHASVVEFLLDNNINNDSKNNEGWSSNHFAAAVGHLDMLKMLINKGFSLKQKTNDNSTLLHIAVENKQEHIVSYLLQYYINEKETNDDGHLPVHLAARSGNLNIFNLLLYKGYSNVKTNYNNSVFQLAVIGGNREIIKLLLEDGADVNSLNNDHDSPLHSAVGECKQNNLEIVQVLLDHGAHFYIKNKAGKTPLDIAKANGYTDIAELLEIQYHLVQIYPN